MAMRRICDICGEDAGAGKAYQFPRPAVLVDNDGAGPQGFDASMTDVCEACSTGKKASVVTKLVDKANSKPPAAVKKLH